MAAYRELNKLLPFLLRAEKIVDCCACLNRNDKNAAAVPNHHQFILVWNRDSLRTTLRFILKGRSV